MRKLILILLIATLFIACNNNNNYTLRTEVPVADFEGKTVSLLLNQGDKWVKLNQAKIKKGDFTMKGYTDSSFIATLMIELEPLPYYLPVAIEPGNIYAKMGQTTYVTGTELNDRLQAFMLAKDAFTDSLKILSADTSNIELFHAFIKEQMQKYNNSYPQLADYIGKHYLHADPLELN